MARAGVRSRHVIVRDFQRQYRVAERAEGLRQRLQAFTADVMRR